MAEHHVLLIEDEQALRMTLSDRLAAEGYGVECCEDGLDGLKRATESAYDLILLDVMLPGKNGFDVCREIRQAGLLTPIIMLTARSSTEDKVVGLKIGADDYVPKPFDMMELMARIEALLRRANNKPVSLDVHHFGPLKVDFRGTEVSRNGTAIPLSAREYQLLRYLIEHRGTTLSRNQMLQEVWGYSADTFTRTVDVHVASLRQKLENDPKRPELILTVPGMGYKFAA
jgi:two-component system, OmpR family, alkaline phosphatase synthesis response regulator PhoP